MITSSEIVPDSIGLADITDVWKNIKCDEKVVFVIHHAERETSVRKESPLTPEGQLSLGRIAEPLGFGSSRTF